MEFLNTLRDTNGRIAIDGFYDDVVPPTAAEKEAMAGIPFNEASQLDYLGLRRFEGRPGGPPPRHGRRAPKDPEVRQ